MLTLYLSWDIPGEITVRYKLQLARLLRRVIDDFNVSRLSEHTQNIINEENTPITTP